MADRSQNGAHGQPGKQAVNAQLRAEAQRLKEYLEPAVRQCGLFLEDVDIKTAGSHRTIHVVVDLPEDQTGGVGLDLISNVSHHLSDALDADPDDDGRPYSLEVSSPGISRPLTEPRHWRRNIGRLVRATLTNGDDVAGRLLQVAETGIIVRPELPVKKGMKPKQGEPVDIRFTSIRKGSVDIEFTHAEDGNPTAPGHTAAAEEG